MCVYIIRARTDVYKEREKMMMYRSIDVLEKHYIWYLLNICMYMFMCIIMYIIMFPIHKNLMFFLARRFRI